MKKILAATVMCLLWAVPQARADLFFPQIAAGDSFATTVTLMNTDKRSTAGAATGTLSFYNPDGTPRTVTTNEYGSGNSFSITIPVGGVRIVTIPNTGSLAVGAARFAVSGGVSVGGVATFTSGSAIVGVNAAESINTVYIPLNTDSGFTNGVAFQNTSSTPENLLLFLLNPDGSTDQESPLMVSLPVNGQSAKIVETDLGFTGSIKPNATLLIQTWFTDPNLTGSPTFAALPLVIGNGLISSGAVVTQELSDISNPIFFPQVVDGSGDTTVFRLVNPYNATATGVIRFFNQDGSPRTIGIAGQNKASVFPFSVAPSGTFVMRTDGTTPGVGVGMARVDSTSPLGGVSTIYLGPMHVGVPNSLPMRSARMAINTSTGMDTGFALANVTAASTNLNLTLQDRQGGGAQTVQQSSLNPLAANGQIAEFASQVGFSRASGVTDSSIVIEPNGAGTFVPIALLESNGVFSTTATSRQRVFDSTSFIGKYAGTWSLPTSGVSGAMSINITQIAPGLDNLALAVTDTTGAITIMSFSQTGTVSADGDLISTNPFGADCRLRSDGILSAYAAVPSTAGTTITSYAINAEYTGTKFSGTLVTSFASGSTETGTFSLTKQ